jgi:hypothetical protein
VLKRICLTVILAALALPATASATTAPQVERQQRNYCLHTLHGHVEQVLTGNMIPALPSEVETICRAHGRNYRLHG